MRHSARSHFFVDCLAVFHSVVACCVVVHRMGTERFDRRIGRSRRRWARPRASDMVRWQHRQPEATGGPDNLLLALLGNRCSAATPAKAAVRVAG